MLCSLPHKPQNCQNNREVEFYTLPSDLFKTPPSRLRRATSPKWEANVTVGLQSSRLPLTRGLSRSDWGRDFKKALKSVRLYWEFGTISSRAGACSRRFYCRACNKL